jgi:ribosomal protein S10
MYIYILRITFKTIKTSNNLQKNIKFLKKIGNFKNIKINGIFKIKNKNKIFTLLRSPHIYKKSREHFIYKNFIFKIDIKFNKIINLLNFIIILKKTIIGNYIINIKIIKNAYNLNG